MMTGGGLKDDSFWIILSMVSWSSKATFSASGINKSGKETGHESNKSFVCAFDFLRSIEEFLMMVLYCSSLISSLVKSIISIVFLLPSLLCVITAFCGVIEWCTVNNWGRPSCKNETPAQLDPLVNFERLFSNRFTITKKYKNTKTNCKSVIYGVMGFDGH